MSLTIAKKYIGDGRVRVGDLVEHIGNQYYYYKILDINNDGSCVIVVVGQKGDGEPVSCIGIKNTVTLKHLRPYNASLLR